MAFRTPDPTRQTELDARTEHEASWVRTREKHQRMERLVGHGALAVIGVGVTGVAIVEVVQGLIVPAILMFGFYGAIPAAIFFYSRWKQRPR